MMAVKLVPGNESYMYTAPPSSAALCTSALRQPPTPRSGGHIAELSASRPCTVRWLMWLHTAPPTAAALWPKVDATMSTEDWAGGRGGG